MWQRWKRSELSGRLFFHQQDFFGVVDFGELHFDNLVHCRLDEASDKGGLNREFAMTTIDKNTQLNPAGAPVGEQGIAVDEDRPLSEDGLRQARSLGQGLKRLGISVNQVLTSPLRRAVQTAEELARVLQVSSSAVE